MQAIDTCVLARWLLGDDAVQAGMAEQVLKERGWVPLTVMLELGWALAKQGKVPRAIVADMLAQVLDLETMVVESADMLGWAIDRYRAGADWGDMLHLAASAEQASGFVTFDGGVAKKAGNDPPMPIRTLRP